MEVGFSKDPKKVFDEVERVTAEMVRQGWTLAGSIVEESMGNVHLMFERSVPMGD